jgi:hypothetical protein
MNEFLRRLRGLVGMGVTEISLWRAAVWGVIGASILPLISPINNSVLTNTIPIGTLFAVATVAVAKRGALTAGEEIERLGDSWDDGE